MTDMDITKLDVTILVSMTLGIVLMSFTFPAMGLAGDEASTSDVPEFSVNGERFDFAGDFPDEPGTPQGGPIVWSEDRSTDNTRWYWGNNTQDGVQLSLVNNGNLSHPEAEFFVQSWLGGSLASEDSVNISTEGGEARIGSGAYETYVTVNEFRNVNSSNLSIHGEYSIIGNEESGGEAWWQNIPVLSTIGESASDAAAAAMYIGTVVLWGFQMIFEVILNAIGMMVDVALFFVGLASWLVSTYTSIVTADSLFAWARVILVIPSVALSVVWAKIILVGIDIIWIG